MNFNRICAIIKRHMLIQTRDIGRLFDVSFWPVLEIILWGFAGVWIAQEDAVRGTTLLIGAFLWQLVVRPSVEVAVGVLMELWSHNICNLMSSPITFSEWIAALLLLTVFKACVMVGVCSLVMWYLYNITIFMFGWWLVPIITLLMLSGWMLGFIASSLVIRWGQPVESFVWAIGWLYSPFCGVFYPLEVMPSWMQLIGKSMPMTYTFAAIQEFIHTQTMATELLLKSFVFNSVGLVLSYLLFSYMYRQSKKQGLMQLEVG